MSRHRKLLLITILLLGAGLLACTISGAGGKPTVEILSPPSGTQVLPGEQVEVQYRATDPTAIVRVELEVDGQVVEVQKSPIEEGQPSLTGLLRWSAGTPGSYSLIVYAYNRDRVRSDAVGVNVIVGEGAPPGEASPTPGSPPAEPVATVPAASLVLSDDFSDADSGWLVQSEEEYGYGYEGGEYVIEHLNQNDRSRWITLPDRTFSDFTAEVDVRFDTDVEFVGGALIWRWQDNDNFYFFRVRNTGEYDLRKRVDGEWERITEATASADINKGAATNRLKVVTVGDSISLYVNGQHLGDFSDSSFSEGRIGLYASVYTESPITSKIFFDNLNVYVAEAGTAPVPSVAVGATPAAYPPASGRIVFASSREWGGENKDLYVMNMDNSELIRLTDTELDDSMPDWSPDGQRIAFVSWRDRNFEIYVMNSDGSGLTKLTDNPARDYHPCWSPDGQRIVFATDRDENFEIYMMNADGSGKTNISNNPAEDRAPEWSPDGKWIAFHSKRSGDNEIYLMKPDGSEVTNLTQNPAADSFAAWSPDGKRIVFSSDRDGDDEIYVMNADGSNVVRLTHDPGLDGVPTWSPDGNYITFYTDRDGNREVYIMRADGTEQRNLSNDPDIDADSDWYPLS
jgi:Tol biopolymer transport system component